jgi:hypothetical protein
LEASFLPPQENGVIWSYSKFKELPQQRHAPPSLAKTIFFVVADTYRLWAKEQILNKSNNSIRYNFFMFIFGIIAFLMRLGILV